MGKDVSMTEMIIQNICLRCGFVNETSVGLTHPDTNATYRCDNCKFIIFTSWIEAQTGEKNDN